MWFAKAVAHGADGSVYCYSDLSGTYVFLTLFECYPIFTIWDLELSRIMNHDNLCKLELIENEEEIEKIRIAPS